jgi:hypothetical protein
MVLFAIFMMIMTVLVVRRYSIMMSLSLKSIIGQIILINNNANTIID